MPTIRAGDQEELCLLAKGIRHHIPPRPWLQMALNFPPTMDGRSSTPDWLVERTWRHLHRSRQESARWKLCSTTPTDALQQTTHPMRPAACAPPGHPPSFACPLRSIYPPVGSRATLTQTPSATVWEWGFCGIREWVNDAGGHVLGPYTAWRVYSHWGVSYLQKLSVMLYCRHIKPLIITSSQPSVRYLTLTFYDDTGYLYVMKKIYRHI
jgi:hypothetical protein